MFAYFNSIQGDIKPCKKEDFDRIYSNRRAVVDFNAMDRDDD